MAQESTIDFGGGSVFVGFIGPSEYFGLKYLDKVPMAAVALIFFFLFHQLDRLFSLPLYDLLRVSSTTKTTTTTTTTTTTRSRIFPEIKNH